MFRSYDDMLEEFEREMRRVSDDMLLQMFRVSGGAGDIWAPRVDVYETNESVVVKVCVAGLDPDHIELTSGSANIMRTAEAGTVPDIARDTEDVCRVATTRFRSTTHIDQRVKKIE